MLLVSPVTLELAPVRLEPLTLAHEKALIRAASDGELWKLRFTSVPEPEQTRAYIETALQSQTAGHRLAFAVVDTQREQVVGSTSYHDIVPAVGRLEIGYTWLAKSAQRSAINTTAKLLLMQHGFETLGAALVGWRTDLINEVSQRAIERLGAKKDGVLRHHALRRDGTVRDTVMYSLRAEEWPPVKIKLLAQLALRR